MAKAAESKVERGEDETYEKTCRTRQPVCKGEFVKLKSWSATRWCYGKMGPGSVTPKLRVRGQLASG